MTTYATASPPRLLPLDGQPQKLSAHLGAYGHAPAMDGGLLREIIAASGLTGRGGAGFPTARKLAAVAGAGRPPVIVGNGAESEPASHKDRTLLWTNPHLVLDGLQLAAAAVGATQAYLYYHRHQRLHGRLHEALTERRNARVDRIRVELVEAPSRFLAGEESALVNRISDGPAVPRFKVPRVFERGIDGAPTLVQNVETLAHLALIARYGASWFRAVGTPDEPGSTLVTTHRTDGTVAVREAPLGTPIASLLALSANPASAVLVGGYHGAWLRPELAATLRLCNADLRPHGAIVGAGLLIALPEDRCGLVESARVARYLALESAGQCGPCFNGLPRIAAAFGDLAGIRPQAQSLADLRRWSALVERRGACHHPDGSVRFLRSALTVFADELAEHARGRCTAKNDRPFLPIPSGAPADEADWR